MKLDLDPIYAGCSRVERHLASCEILAPAQATACAKVILLGEHAVVYGARAIAVPLSSLQMRLSLEPVRRRSPQRRSIPQCSVYFSGVPVAGGDVPQTFLDALGLFGECQDSLVIRGDSEIPLGAGLGSSAALCVAAVRVVAQARGAAEPAPSRLAELANHLEHRFHGKPSGLDTAVIAHQQPVIFSRAQGSTPLPAHRSVGRVPLLLVDSGERACTKHMVEKARPHLTGGDGSRRVGAMDALVDVALDSWVAGDWPTLGRAMNDYHDHLRECSASTPRIEAIVAAARKLGALGAKLTGAGGGGQVLVLGPAEAQVDQWPKMREIFGDDAVREVYV